MKRVFVVVEGQTEATFLSDVVAPELRPELSIEPRILGGLNSYGKLRNLLRMTLLDSHASIVVDFCDITPDFPGYAHAPNTNSPRELADQISAAITRDLDDPRLLPYFSLHEFEALVFAALGAMELTELRTILAEHRASDQQLRDLQDTARRHDTPEEIDGGRETQPSRRLAQLIRRYRKTADGTRIVAHAGLAA